MSNAFFPFRPILRQQRLALQPLPPESFQHLHLLLLVAACHKHQPLLRDVPRPRRHCSRERRTQRG